MPNKITAFTASVQPKNLPRTNRAGPCIAYAAFARFSIALFRCLQRGTAEGTLHGTCRNYPDTGNFTERICFANNFFHQQSIYLSTITGKPRRTRETPVTYRLFTDKFPDDARLLFFGHWCCRNRHAPNTSFVTVGSLFRALPPPR